MLITHSYLGATQGKYRYLFYILYEDYVDTQKSFIKEIENLLIRFARNLGDDSVVIKPFIDDISKTKQEVLEKDWSDEAKVQIENTPGMIMLNIDLASFDPGNHPWFYFQFGNNVTYRLDSRVVNINTIDNAKRVFGQLEQFAMSSDVDIFEEAKKLRDNKAKEVLGIFEAKPGVFGFSIDLIKGFDIFRSIFTKSK